MTTENFTTVDSAKLAAGFRAAAESAGVQDRSNYNRAEMVHAIIVAFHPEGGRFLAELRALATQVGAIVVVDNGGVESRLSDVLRGEAVPGCTLLPQKANIGLAAGQNAGIRYAMSAGADYVLLLDDDSIPGERMVEKLLHALQAAVAGGDRIAAAGPRYVEQRSSVESHFLRYGALGARKLRCAQTDEVLLTDSLISSGMLIPAQAMRDVGTMDESLFIDHVDTDWCLRARANGYRMLGVCAALMSHRMGDKPSGEVVGRRVFFRSPERHYYLFRNSVLLYRRSYSPLGWAIADAFKLLALFVVIAVACAPRTQHIVAAASGVADGLRRRTGPRP